MSPGFNWSWIVLPSLACGSLLAWQFAPAARRRVRFVWGLLATAVLLADCLGRIGAGEDVPGALAAAQRALRQMTRDALIQWIADYLLELRPTLTAAIGEMPAYPFAHPDDWAGFFAAGC